jgi:CubicO group peptidase (beta-lactamase class C family)
MFRERRCRVDAEMWGFQAIATHFFASSAMRQGYHAITLDLYQNELLRRIDPQHRSLGQFFEDEIASPLGIDFYIRLPQSIPNSRLAIVSRAGLIEMLRGFGLRFAYEALNPRTNISPALRGSAFPYDKQKIYARDFEVPSGGGGGTARAIARAYSVFATDGRELGLRRDTPAVLAAPAVAPSRGCYDECMKVDGVQFSLGFMKPGSVWQLGRPHSAFPALAALSALPIRQPAWGMDMSPTAWEHA